MTPGADVKSNEDLAAYVRQNAQTYFHPVGTCKMGEDEIVPASAVLNVLRTGRETTQPDRRALEYWASGLEPLYLAGAFERAV